MSPRSSPRWPYLLACAALAACVAAAVTTTAQSSTDKWWPGYGSGPDNSRYFPSQQITRGNVGRVQVAWTYPFGDTGSGPIVVRGVIYGRGRNASLVALDAATGDARLAEYQPYWAARAGLLARTDALDAADEAYQRAIGLEPDPAVRRFLQQRRERLRDSL